MKTTIANNRSKEKTEHGNPVANEFDRVAFTYETIAFHYGINRMPK